MARSIAVLLFSIVTLFVVSIVAAKDPIVITDATRTIKITSQIVRVTVQETIRNDGKGHVSNFLFAMIVDEAMHMSSLSAIIVEDKVPLELYKEKSNPGFWNIPLPNSIGPGEEMQVKISYTLAHFLNPLPEKVGQTDDQFFVFEGSHYIYSPYLVKKQITKLKLMEQYESVTALEPYKVTDTAKRSLEFGSYFDIEAKTVSELKCRFKGTSEFLSVINELREIQVTHWGANIHVEETFEVINDGPEHEGQWSRLDYQRNPKAQANGIPGVTIRLPAGAKDIWYRDVIGNISTSQFADKKKGVDLEIQFRFPLFGGWKDRFTIGYNVPAEGLGKQTKNPTALVTKEGKGFQVKMPVGAVIDNVPVDELLTKVSLPEGAKNGDWALPMVADDRWMENLKTYLDTAGRPVFCMRKRMTVSDVTAQPFTLTYTYSSLNLLRKPLILTVILFAISAIVLVVPLLSGNAAEEDISKKKKKQKKTD